MTQGYSQKINRSYCIIIVLHPTPDNKISWSTEFSLKMYTYMVKKCYWSCDTIANLENSIGVQVVPLFKLFLTPIANTVFLYGETVPSGPGPCHYRGFTIPLRHTTLVRTSLDERPLPDSTQCSHERDIPAPAGFEPIIPVSKWPQSHALDRAATGTFPIYTTS